MKYDKEEQLEKDLQEVYKIIDEKFSFVNTFGIERMKLETDKKGYCLSFEPPITEGQLNLAIKIYGLRLIYEKNKAELIMRKNRDLLRPDDKQRYEFFTRNNLEWYCRTFHNIDSITPLTLLRNAIEVNEGKKMLGAYSYEKPSIYGSPITPRLKRTNNERGGKDNKYEPEGR